MARSFVLVGDEVFALATGRGPEAELFQTLAKGGPGGGRAGTTQQGTFCFAPSGELLGADNTRDPDRLIRLLQTSLSRWEQLSEGRKYRAEPPAADPPGRQRWESYFPKDGLILRQYSRDLGSTARALGDYEKPWNSDVAWFSAEEVKSLIPAPLQAGAKRGVPAALVRRLARLHLIDAVLGQGLVFSDAAVTQANLNVEVTGVQGSLATLHFQGATRAGVDQRGIETQILGNATFDSSQQKFTAFELLAVGMRRGAAFRNPYIRNDTGAGPIGFAFHLAGASEVDRIAPTHFPAYGWRR